MTDVARKPSLSDPSLYINREFFEERRRILNRELMPALEEEGIRMMPHSKVRAAERRELREKFVTDILPILTPLAIDPAHPFPHISNLSLNLLVVIEDEGRRVMARVKVPTTIDRFVRLPDAEPSADGR